MFNTILDDRSVFVSLETQKNHTPIYLLAVIGCVVGIVFHHRMTVGASITPEEVFWMTPFAGVVYLISLSCGIFMGRESLKMAGKRYSFSSLFLAFTIPIMMPIVAVLYRQFFEIVIAS